jgi:hypothetical protein
MIGMKTRVPGPLALAALLTAAPILAQSAPNACSLLTDAEVAKLITRGRPVYDQVPEAVALAGGAASVCDYPTGGQIGFWAGPKAQENFERTLKSFGWDKEARQPISGVGDRAFIMFPTPEKHKDRAAFLVATVGQQLVTAALFAHDGNADGWMGEVCRGDQSRLSAKEKADCTKVLADKSETQESLQPAVIELAKAVVANVRAGKGTR